MYFLSCLTDSGLFCLLPIWLTSSRLRGGLGYSVIDVGLCLSSSSFVLLFAVDVFRVRLAYILKNSPIRAMRIGCALTVLFCFLLPNLLSDNQRSESATVSTASNSLRGSADKVRSSVETVQTGIRAALFGPPQNNPIALLIPSFLLAGAVSAGQICRKSSAVLLHVALAPSFSTPSTVTTVVRNMAEITGPVLFSLILAAVNHLNLRYPMDVSFLLSLTSCISFLLYTCTLLLSIQYRGDFGLIADVEETVEEKPVNNNLSFRDKNRNNYYEQNNGKGNGLPDSDKNSSGILSVPITDLSLLFSSISNANGVSYYSNKNHNLKMNLKDV